MTGAGIHWSGGRIVSYFSRLSERWHVRVDIVASRAGFRKHPLHNDHRHPKPGTDLDRRNFSPLCCIVRAVPTKVEILLPGSGYTHRLLFVAIHSDHPGVGLIISIYLLLSSAVMDMINNQHVSKTACFNGAAGH
jgi:hypothetical protein